MDFLHIKTLYLEVTHACNQQCRHCYLDGGIQKPTMEMSFEQIKEILQQFKEQGGTYIIITGGEPLVRTDIFSILDYIEELSIPFNFASNGLALNKARFERLTANKCLDMYFTSILGSDAAKHKMISSKDSYNKVINSLVNFEKRNIPIYVQVTLANAYLNDMEQIADTLLKHDNCTVKFTPIATLGTKTEEANRGIIVPEDRFSLFHSNITSLQSKYPDRIENGNILNHEQIAEIIADYKHEKLYALSYGFIAVRPNGDISFSCNMGNPYTFGKAYESIRIPVDQKLLGYVELLRNAESLALRAAEHSIIEFDVAVDRYIVKQTL